MKISDEDEAFDGNIAIYNDLLTFFRECMDAYMIMQR
jgi:hypothetical protein